MEMSSPLQSICASAQSNQALGRDQRSYLFEEFSYETQDTQSELAPALRDAITNRHHVFLRSMIDMQVLWGAKALSEMPPSNWVLLFDEFSSHAGMHHNFGAALSGKWGPEAAINALEACELQPHLTKMAPSVMSTPRKWESPYLYFLGHYIKEGHEAAMEWMMDHYPIVLRHKIDLSEWCILAALKGHDQVVMKVLPYCYEPKQLIEQVDNSDLMWDRHKTFFSVHQVSHAKQLFENYATHLALTEHVSSSRAAPSKSSKM